METKRKSRFPKVLLVVIIILGMAFAFGANKLKNRYRVLDLTSQEVSSSLSEIKDYRKIKGYKIIKDTNNYKIVLISSGLTYNQEDSLTVENVDFKSGKVNITVKENLSPTTEKEVITYPCLMLKVDTIMNQIEIKNTNGEIYEEINLHDPQAGLPNKEVTDKTDVEKEDKEDIVADSQQKEDKEDIASDSQQKEDKEDIASDSQQKEDKEDIASDSQQKEDKEENYVVGEYQGRIDGGMIEVKIGESDYEVFDISDVAMTFKNYDIGTKLKITYVEKNGVKVLKSVK